MGSEMCIRDRVWSCHHVMKSDHHNSCRIAADRRVGSLISSPFFFQRHGGVTRGATRWRDTWQVVEPLLRCLTALAGPHTLVLLSASLLHSPETIELFRSEARNEFSTAEDLIRAEMQPAATRHDPY